MKRLKVIKKVFPESWFLEVSVLFQIGRASHFSQNALCSPPTDGGSNRGAGSVQGWQDAVPPGPDPAAAAPLDRCSAPAVPHRSPWHWQDSGPDLQGSTVLAGGQRRPRHQHVGGKPGRVPRHLPAAGGDPAG